MELGRKPTYAIFLVFAIAIWGLFAIVFNTSSNPTIGKDYGIEQIIGIHFGRTDAKVGIIHNNYTFEVISDGEYGSSIPSCVTFVGDGRALVGFEAREHVASHLGNTICDVRSLIGRNFSDVNIEDTHNLPENLIVKNGSTFIPGEVDGVAKLFTPEDLTTMIFRNLKDIAERSLNTTVNDAIITVPTYFDERQRQATNNSATMGGFNVVRIIDESTAACLAYGLDTADLTKGSEGCTECYFVIYNLEDDSSNVVLQSITEGAVFKVLAMERDATLGGNDFEHEIFYRNIDPGLGTCQVPKVLMGSGPDGCGSDEASPLGPHRKNSYFSTRAFGLVTKLLEKASLEMKDIKGIIFTGNNEEALHHIETHFNPKKILSSPTFSPSQAIVHGAAVQAHGHSHAKECTYPADVAYLSLGIETGDDIFTTVIPRGFVIPTRKRVEVMAASNENGRIVVKMLEGERLVARKNRLLATLEFAGFLVKSECLVGIVFELDSRWGLKVVVEEVDTGREVSVVIDGVLSDATFREIEVVVGRAAVYRDEDEEFLRLRRLGPRTERDIN